MIRRQIVSSCRMATLKRKVKKYRRKVRYSFLYWMLRFMIFFSNLMPRKAWLRAIGSLGNIAYHIASRSRKLTIRHLTMVYGKEKSPDEIKTLAKQVFRFIGMNGADLLRGFRITSKEAYE